MKNVRLSAGDRFGKWIVMVSRYQIRNSKTMHLCVCDCGTFSIVYDCHMKSGKTTGCKDCAITTHGQTRTPTWNSWHAMHTRCKLKSHQAFYRYGGRGISVCECWNDYENFVEDMGQRPAGFTLDRINVNAGYFKENCRWATPKEQSNNSSWNNTVVYKGNNYTVAQLAEHLDMNYLTLWARLKRGTPVDAPLRKAKTPHAKRNRQSDPISTETTT